MKKIFCLVLSFLLLCGCKGNFRKIEPVTKGIDFSAEIKYYNEQYECNCTVDKNGEMTASFTYPAEIKGLEFAVSENKVTAKYNGLTVENKNKIFENTAAYLIWEAFTNVSGEVESENDVFFLEGKTEEFDYRLELGSSGLPIKLTTKPDIIEVVFKNVKIK